MLFVASFGALVLAHLLPGRLLAEWLGLGRDREERWIASAVLGGPIAAVVHAASLAVSWAPLYWVLLLGLDITALILARRSVAVFGFSRHARRYLLALIAIVLAGYLATTGSLYRLDDEGNLLLDRALQRDALFHVGVSRSLETDYPPTPSLGRGNPHRLSRGLPPSDRRLVEALRARRLRRFDPGRSLLSDRAPGALRLYARAPFHDE